MKNFFSKLKVILFFAVTVYVAKVSAQDIHFSQFNSAPLLLNPASTGSMKQDFRFNSQYKDQWTSISHGYKTMYASFDANLMANHPRKKKNALGAGIAFFSDKAGETKFGLTMVNLSIAYHLNLDRSNRIGAGMQSGLGQRSINFQSLRWDNQFDGDRFNTGMDPMENLPNPSFMFLDVSAGLIYNHKSDYLIANAGISRFHVNRPSQSFYSRYGDFMFTKFVFHADMEIPLQFSNTILMPMSMVSKQGPYYEIIGGGLIKYILGLDSKYTGLKTSSAFYIGSLYRFQDAIVLITRYDFKNNWSMGLSYDINVSRLRVATSGRGGLEISLIYRGMFQ
jgi:type IX secretion system PorP/SprF family membrane protein